MFQEILLLAPKDASLPPPEHVTANDVDYVIELKAASFSWPEVQSHPTDNQLQSNHNGNLVIKNGPYKGSFPVILVLANTRTLIKI